MAAQPPSLPYARDEASTSQPLSAYPAYPGDSFEAEHDMQDMEEEDGAEASAALQYWTAKRHRGMRLRDKNEEEYAMPWRLRSRLKTISAVMFICLNLGVDPPDVVKTNPCAKLECWVDPTQLPSNKAIEAIGRNLQQQFETLNPKVKYRAQLDPSIEETKKACINLRKSSREERMLFYYNGHGVPKPTAGGEIWVFNKKWMGSPCIYIWECSGAGNIITNFNKCAQRRDDDARHAASQNGNGSNPDYSNPDLPGSAYMDSIHLAACTANQVLPMSPDLPADLFTCCLTSPIEIALRYFVLQDPLKRNLGASGKDARARITVDMVMRIPGDLKDRRTPLGELNWIFTAVTDTIAWLSFPRDVFNRLFRQDLLVAALFRNFLLANRVMTTYHCTPVSHPELPSTHGHPLWDSWDLAVDAVLAQLPELLDLETARENGQSTAPPLATYRPSLFFAQHLQAFEVWLQHGGAVPNNLSLKPRRPTAAILREPPEQLPIVLQVLLSQAHRLRALILLSRFVDLGPWAVHLALSIGIFPYVQKLLQSPAVELKPVLIFIWARILAVDKSCQVDLLKDAGYNYFAQILSPYPTAGAPLVIPNANEHRAMCAFILSMLCRGFKPGQTACLAINVFDSCLARLQEDDWLLRTWCLLCIAQLWSENDDAKAMCLRDQRQDVMIAALRSTAVEVRAAALYAFGTFLGASSSPIESEARGGGGTGAQLGISEHNQLEVEAGLAFACMMHVKEDASPMVRKELVVVISCVVREWRGWFVCAAWVYYEQERAGEKRGGVDLVAEALDEWTRNEDRSPEEHQINLTLLSSFKIIFEALLDLSVDPHLEVSVMASTVVDYISALLLDSAFARVDHSAIALKDLQRSRATTRQPSLGRVDSSRAHTPGAPKLSRTNTETSLNGSSNGSLKRNSSVANALRSLATITGFLPFESTESAHSTPVESPIPQPAPKRSSQAEYKSPYPHASHQTILPDGVPRSSLRSGMSRFNQSPAEAVHVLEALTEEDMERLRIRRLKGNQAGGDVDGRLGNNGLPRHNDLGLGMVAKEVKDDVLPLRSGFFDWAVEYFREPQMKAWRHVRNETLVEKSREDESFAAEHAWSKELGTLHNDSLPLQLAFHSFDPHLAVTDDADTICIWDWKTHTKVNTFSNENVAGSSISSIHFINEMASSLMLTASSGCFPGPSAWSDGHVAEGSIHIFRDYDQPGQTSLASTFRAVSDLYPVGQSSGVLTAWEQQKGHLLVGGDMKVVRLWDATVERHLRDIATQAGANLTAIASDEPDGNVFVAGFGDGVVRLFDKRIEDASNVVLRTWREHHTWIQSVHLQRGGNRELVTGSMNGEVRIWDVRHPDKPLYQTVAQPNGLGALAVHTGAPVLATTSAPSSHSTSQRLDIQGFSDPVTLKNLGRMNINVSPMVHAPQRIKVVPLASSLVFHPVEMVIAAAGSDHTGTVRLYGCPTPSRIHYDPPIMNGH
ncbi:regulatory associated protein of mTOR, partial [Tremellales sp. Uapishka_1]